jgi:hypothetical protein
MKRRNFLPRWAGFPEPAGAAVAASLENSQSLPATIPSVLGESRQFVIQEEN